LVAGHPEPNAGTWTDSLRKVPGEARSELVESSHPDAQLAILHYRTRATTTAGTWLEIELETGRTHQIRLQAAAHGHAVLGDSLYGSPHPFGPPTEDERARAIALHARAIEFLHPMTNLPIVLAAPLPDYWPGEDG
jgi:23S rRNA pseudouridine1911/1915/1917 synthase